MGALSNAFKGFDINNVDVNEAGNWPVGVKIVVYVLLFSALVGAAIYFYVNDQYIAVEREIAKEPPLKTEFKNKAFQVANLPALRKQMADVEGRFSELLTQLPTDKEVPGLLEELSDIGRGAGLVINSIALQPERKSKFYIELPININVVGSYHELGQFVSGVAAIDRIVTLHDFNVRPGSGDLGMTIQAKTYRYDDTK
ncbi:type 4a pilus biogenesis protein PilO [Marinobacterium rhizophilum]|uniref:Type 4a pilus biogenesis protein PilO n=1 Tax=Marinobacterium rhizophilum TaxID=420402 RepID=A0ABY5HE31_9GAMM|nr:type 4a pilus biogenesis protein PilO [Marinobacterium rhizophilum]UTW10478.1 type 4a pilus biogenesis protein PilO [Marinobacterium rhizophilum]